MNANRPRKPSPLRSGGRRASRHRTRGAALALAGAAFALAGAGIIAGAIGAGAQPAGSALSRWGGEAPPHTLLIGVGIHRNAAGFDPARTAALIRLFEFDGVRDEIGNAGFDQGPANPDYPTRALPELASLMGGVLGPGTVLALTGGGSGRYLGGLPTASPDREAYTHFVSQVAVTSIGASPALELFNEWNLPTARRQAGTPEAYAAIVRQAVPEIRARAPGARILVGAIGNDFRRDGGAVVYNDWTRRFIATGAWALGDALSVHLYANCMAGEDRLPARMIDRLRDIERTLSAAHGGKPFPIDVTEVGWPAAHGTCGFSADERRAFPAQFLLSAAALPWLHGVWIYELRDDKTGAPDIEANFGIVQDDGRLKPEGCGLFQAIRLVRSAGVVGIDRQGGVTVVHLGNGAQAVWSDGGQTEMPLPQGWTARSLCALRDQAGGPVAVSALPVVIYRLGDPAVSRALDRPFRD